MLHESLLPAISDPHAHRSQQPTAADDDYVRPPDDHIQDVLLPPLLLLGPQASESNPNAQPASSGTPSLFRRLFTSLLFVYLTALCVASLVVAVFAPRAGCSHTLVVFIVGNGTVSGLLALLTMYATCSAPRDLSQLAVTADRSDHVRWVTLTCVKQLVGLADFVFFIIGHVAFFSSGSASCGERSPLLHSFALLSLISGYVGIVLPLLLFLYLSLTYRSYLFRPREPQVRKRPAHAREIAACQRGEWTAAAAAEIEAADAAAAMCSICYVEFEAGDVLLQLPCDVKHAFHEPCITRWLEICDTCPLCKARLKHSLKRAGRAATAANRAEDQPSERPRPVPGRASLNEIAPFLPGTMAASYSLSAAYQQSHQSEQKEEDMCPSPSPGGTPLSGSPAYGPQKEAAADQSAEEVDIRVCIRDDGAVEQTGRDGHDAVDGGEVVTAAVSSSSSSSRSAAVAAALARLAAAKANTIAASSLLLN